MNTPFMNLLLPTVSVTLGPEWATELNQALTIVDAHNHTSGDGVPIPSAGISLDADLPFNSFNATLLRSTRYVDQVSPISGVNDLGCLYISSGNLYYNNLLGQQVQITQGAGLDASSVGGFGGDYGTSTASAFYTSATSTFTFWQSPSVSAIMDTGPIVLHPLTSIAFGITLRAPVGISANYNATLPSAVPASTKILTMDNSGTIGNVYDVDNSTITVSSNTLMVPASGITATQLATDSVITSKIQDTAVTFPKVQASNIVTTASSGAFSTSSTSFVLVTNQSNTITTTGRAVFVSLQPDGTTNSGIIASNAGAILITIQIQRNGTPVYQADMVVSSLAKIPPAIYFLDYAVVGSPAVLGYQVFAKVNAGTGFINNCITVLHEML